MRKRNEDKVSAQGSEQVYLTACYSFQQLTEWTGVPHLAAAAAGVLLTGGWEEVVKQNKHSCKHAISRERISM